jgi:hypothetical protein
MLLQACVGYSYQWYLGVNPIGGATNSSYAAEWQQEAITVVCDAGPRVPGTSNSISITENPVTCSGSYSCRTITILQGHSVSLSAKYRNRSQLPMGIKETPDSGMQQIQTTQTGS